MKLVTFTRMNVSLKKKKKNVAVEIQGRVSCGVKAEAKQHPKNLE